MDMSFHLISQHRGDIYCGQGSGDTLTDCLVNAVNSNWGRLKGKLTEGTYRGVAIRKDSGLEQVFEAVIRPKDAIIAG